MSRKSRSFETHIEDVIPCLEGKGYPDRGQRYDFGDMLVYLHPPRGGVLTHIETYEAQNVPNQVFPVPPAPWGQPVSKKMPNRALAHTLSTEYLVSAGLK